MTRYPLSSRCRGTVTLGAMAGADRWARAARGPFARLMAVLTVVAGLALLNTPQCADGMTPVVHVIADHTAASGSMAMDHEGSAAVEHPLTAPDQAVATTPSPVGLGTSALMTCLTLLILTLAVLVILRRPEIPLGVWFFDRHAPPSRRRRVLRPNLAQLCVLRT